jgi:hypothetical protein
MRCQRCGRSFYSASAPALVARGDRCSWCGGPLDLLCPSCGAIVDLPEDPAAPAGADPATPD